MSARTWPLWAQITAALAIILLLWWLLYRLFIAPGIAAHDVAQTRQNVAAAQGEIRATGDTLNILLNRSAEQDGRRTVTEENSNAILSSNGARDAVPPNVDRAGLCAVRRLRN